VYHAVSIPFVQQFIDDQGEVQANEIMEITATALLDELQRVEGALRPLRQPAASSVAAR